MKNVKQKKILLVLASVALLLTVAVSSTLAFLTDRTESVTNVFSPTELTVSIADSVNGNVKSNIVIKNESEDVKAWIRAKVVANWQINGVVVASWKDDIVYNTAWKKGADGFYYYSEIVDPNTPIPAEHALFASYTAPEAPVKGAQLVMDIIVQGVQAEGIGAANAEAAFNTLEATPAKLN